MVVSSKIKAGIIGATGYAGAELVRLLMSHPGAEVAAVSSVSFEGKPLSAVYPSLRGICDDVLQNEDAVIGKSDVVFASLPHGLSEKLAEKCAAAGKAFIDLGADFRLEAEEDYKEWYGLSYNKPQLHSQAVYCIPELHRQNLGESRLVANPGCYPTSIGLGLAPAVSKGLIRTEGIVIDSKSGVTGAGRGLTQNTHYPDCNEAFAPYKVACHRHTPEIEQTLSHMAGKRVTVTFVPHLLPVNRGIVSTIYADVAQGVDFSDIVAAYEAFYEKEKFVRVLPQGEIANLKNVKYSNYCDISLHHDARAGKLILVSTIDNMVKGAAGQAIQNMNLIMGIEESTGLDLIPPAF